MNFIKKLNKWSPQKVTVNNQIETFEKCQFSPGTQNNLTFY